MIDIPLLMLFVPEEHCSVNSNNIHVFKSFTSELDTGSIPTDVKFYMDAVGEQMDLGGQTGECKVVKLPVPQRGCKKV